MEGQYGQVSRTLAIPANPRTPAQMTIRRNLSKVSARWRALTGDPTGGLDGRGQEGQEPTRVWAKTAR